MKLNQKSKGNGWAFLPLLVFVFSYLIVGIVLESQGVDQAFYQFPTPVAAMLGIIVAFFLFKGSVSEKMDTFVKGCGDDNIIIMCLIYLLAGAFSTVAKTMGGVDATVNLGLSVLPPSVITAGLFVIAAFLGTSTGSAMGTVGALAPVAVGFADKAGIPLPLMLAAVVGGGMFGDNLSIVSDTTIAATRTQGVEMKDKFRLNLLIALPPAVITVLLLLLFGSSPDAVALEGLTFNLVKVIPYLLVLVLALVGMNVLVVLTSGIVVAGVIGIAYGDLTPLSFSQNIFDGFGSMLEIFLLSMLIGGLTKMVSKAGGMDFLLRIFQKFVRGPKSAQLSIGALTLATDAATANNTVAILIDGPIAKQISQQYKVDPRKTASILDIFSCVMQGLIPYGAQILLAGSLSEGAVSPFSIVPFMWYPMLLFGFTVLSIFVLMPTGRCVNVLGTGKRIGRNKERFNVSKRGCL